MNNECIYCQNSITSQNHYLDLCFFCFAQIDRFQNKHCIHDDSHTKNVFAFGIYKGILRALILRFKNSNNLFLAPLLARFLCEPLKLHQVDFDIIVPIPLHILRYLNRGFNQSALLSHFLGKHMRKPVVYNFIYRKKITKKQKFSTKTKRKNNVRNAFSINSKINLSRDTKILIIDDVCTSGATLLEAQKTLAHYGFTNIMSCVIAITKE